MATFKPKILKNKNKSFLDTVAPKPEIKVTPKVDEGAFIPAPNTKTPMSPKVIRDDKTGLMNGIELPDGRTLLGLSPSEVKFMANRYLDSSTAPPGTQFADEVTNKKLTEQQQQNNAAEKQKIIQDYNDAKAKKDYENSQITPNVTAEQLSQLTNLTPEQQALADSNPELNNDLNLKRIAAAALEKGAMGAATGATGGALIGALGGPAAPLTVPAAAGIGALGGAITGVGYGTFATIKETTSDNVALIDQNVINAKYNLNSAATKARRGAPYEEVKQIIGENIAALDLAERQYKEKSKYLFDTKSKTKMEKLLRYKEDVMPGVIYNAEIALQNPNKNVELIDAGVDENGDALETP